MSLSYVTTLTKHLWLFGGRVGGGGGFSNQTRPILVHIYPLFNNNVHVKYSCHRVCVFNLNIQITNLYIQNSNLYIQNTNLYIQNTNLYIQNSNLYIQNTNLYIQNTNLYIQNSNLYIQNTNLYIQNTNLYIQNTNLNIDYEYHFQILFIYPAAHTWISLSPQLDIRRTSWGNI